MFVLRRTRAACCTIIECLSLVDCITFLIESSIKIKTKKNLTKEYKMNKKPIRSKKKKKKEKRKKRKKKKKETNPTNTTNKQNFRINRKLNTPVRITLNPRSVTPPQLINKKSNMRMNPTPPTNRFHLHSDICPF